MRRAISAACLLAVLIGLPLFLPASANAHGRELRVTLAAEGPAAREPLERRYRATVTYGDGDPASGLGVWVAARRQGGDPAAGPQRLSAAGAPGSYAGTLTLPQYGHWQLTVRVEGGADGPVEGVAVLEEEVLPAAPEPAGAQENAAIARLRIGFGARDVLNLAALIVHLVGTVLWLGAVTVVLGAAHVATHGTPGPLLAVARRWFGPAAGGGLALLAASGAYNAIYNVPSRAPGLFVPAMTLRLPFGGVYLALFAAKLVLVAAIVVLTAWLGLLLRRTFPATPRAAAGPAVLPSAVQQPNGHAVAPRGAGWRRGAIQEVLPLPGQAAAAMAAGRDASLWQHGRVAQEMPLPLWHALSAPPVWLGQGAVQPDGELASRDALGGPASMASPPAPSLWAAAAAGLARRLAAVLLLLGLAVLLTVVAMGYLHRLSHLSALVG